MRRLLWDPRTARVMVGSVVFWLLLGWIWGDDWLWTVLRAIGATLTIVATSALYATNLAAARISRVAVGSMLGAACADVLGGGFDVVLATASLFAAFLLAIEYVIQRDVRRRTTSD